MNLTVTVNHKQLLDVLLNVGLIRPVFIWGAPGIGKSAIVEQFAQQLGLDCVSLLGSQLAPEDIIGVPQIRDGFSQFCPPRTIARQEPYVLFLDEQNACSSEVQKAFYSLIHERRIGEDALRILAAGSLSPQHATQFLAYIRQVRSQYALDKILAGEQPWPDRPEERDVLYFLAQSLRARLVKELPLERDKLTNDSRELVLRAKNRITELADISLEIARMAVTPEDGKELPDWFVVELFRDLPRLADKRNG